MRIFLIEIDEKIKDSFSTGEIFCWGMLYTFQGKYILLVDESKFCEVIRTIADHFGKVIRTQEIISLEEADELTRDSV